MQLFNDAKGYKTVDNAKKAAAKKGINLDETRYIVIVNGKGRYNLAFHMNDMGVAPAHAGFCVYN